MAEVKGSSGKTKQGRGKRLGGSMYFSKVKGWTTAGVKEEVSGKSGECPDKSPPKVGAGWVGVEIWADVASRSKDAH